MNTDHDVKHCPICTKPFPNPETRECPDCLDKQTKAHYFNISVPPAAYHAMKARADERGLTMTEYVAMTDRECRKSEKSLMGPALFVSVAVHIGTLYAVIWKIIF